MVNPFVLHHTGLAQKWLKVDDISIYPWGKLPLLDKEVVILVDGDPTVTGSELLMLYLWHNLSLPHSLRCVSQSVMKYMSKTT